MFLIIKKKILIIMNFIIEKEIKLMGVLVLLTTYTIKI